MYSEPQYSISLLNILTLMLLNLFKKISCHFLMFSLNWFCQQPPYGAPPPDHRPDGPPPISEAEFEEIMGRNRTVSSSAIARAVSDAAAGKLIYP